MGRKIPGRKHHGLRDLEKQFHQRTELLKDKINSAPCNPHDQEITRTLLKVMELTDKIKSDLISIKRKRNHKRGEKLVRNHPFGMKQKKNFVKKKKDELETSLKQVETQQNSTKGEKKVVKSDQPKLTKSQQIFEI